MSAGRHPWRGRLALLVAVSIWSATPIFQYWLAGPFDAWTQNFYRYAAGFLTMAPFLLWMAWRTHRDEPGIEGHRPRPADRFENLVDTAFRLDPQDAKIRLQIAKDRQEMLSKDLNVLLDPRTLLLTTGVKR